MNELSCIIVSGLPAALTSDGAASVLAAPNALSLSRSLRDARDTLTIGFLPIRPICWPKHSPCTSGAASAQGLTSLGLPVKSVVSGCVHKRSFREDDVMLRSR